ncbi:MAG: tetratricopeptide repeat protein [Alistipes sp.]
MGRSHIAQEQYAEGAAQLEKFVADYPSSPRRAQALSDLGLAYLNLGDKEKSLRYYDMVVETAPQSSEPRARWKASARFTFRRAGWTTTSTMRRRRGWRAI